MDCFLKRFFIILSSLTIFSCGQGSDIPTPDPHYQGDGYVDSLPDESLKGVTLHAFNWTYKQVENNLDTIKNNGFKNVQISPVQQPKGGGASWWSFYQPLSFSIANNSPLGTKEDLISLCHKADELGISIIADVIFNHMANVDDNTKESDGTPTVNPDVANYEPIIYSLRNDKDNPTFHHNIHATGSGAVTQYYPYGNLPDLNTSNPLVQQKCLALMKECIDVGVDGFRIDTAKHIETPLDPDYPSNFWEETVEVAKLYYKNKTGRDLYVQGEILGSPDGGRDISLYTKYMIVSEDGYIQGVNSALNSKEASRAEQSSYGKNTNSSNLMTWVESHDTFMNASSHIGEKKIAREWAVIASRKEITCNFLARPDNNGTVGQIYSYQFEDQTIASINKFHNRFYSAEEHQSSNGSYYINERYTDSIEGAMIVDFAISGKMNVHFHHLKDGTYVDQITGQLVSIYNGNANFTCSEIGIAILTHTVNKPKPFITISLRDTPFVDSIDVNLSPNNSIESYYTINGGDKTYFESQTKITINKNMVNQNNKVILLVHLSNGLDVFEKSFIYTKLTPIAGYFNVFNLKEIYLHDYELYYWAWGTSIKGKWEKTYEYRNNILLIDFSKTNYSSFLLAIFPKGYQVTILDTWDTHAIKQSSDISISSTYYDASGF